MGRFLFVTKICAPLSEIKSYAQIFIDDWIKLAAALFLTVKWTKQVRAMTHAYFRRGVVG